MRLDSFSAASSSALRSSSFASATSSNDASCLSRSLEFASTTCFRVAIRSLWSSFIFLADSSVLSLRGGFTLSCGLAGAISRVAAMTARINTGFLIVDLREGATPFLPSAMRERSCMNVSDASNCVVSNNIFDAEGNEALIDSEPAVKNGQLLSSNVLLDYNLY